MSHWQEVVVHFHRVADPEQLIMETTEDPMHHIGKRQCSAWGNESHLQALSFWGSSVSTSTPLGHRLLPKLTSSCFFAHTL
jgi:hypothetical protein